MSAPAGLVLRPQRASDEDFLKALFASTREHLLAALPPDAQLRATFIDLQFKAQCQAYHRDCAGAVPEIIEIDGTAVGRWIVDRSGETVRLVDLSLMPPHRGRGIGGALLRGLLAEAAASGRRVSLSVAVDNPAQRLYARLGFQTVARDGLYLRQENGAGP